MMEDGPIEAIYLGKLIFDMVGKYGGPCTKLDEGFEDFHAPSILADQIAT